MTYNADLIDINCSLILCKLFKMPKKLSLSNEEKSKVKLLLSEKVAIPKIARYLKRDTRTIKKIHKFCPKKNKIRTKGK